MNLTQLCENGWVPDWATRFGMRNLNRQRAIQEGWMNPAVRRIRRDRFFAARREGDVAPHGEAAREQHYEVPAPFYEVTLGPRLKYSSGWFEGGRETLADGEEAMLRITAERAGIEDGMKVLDLGCGWGSVSLYLAEHFPKAKITAVSNSASQKAFIDGRAQRLGLKNLTVITEDVNTFDTEDRFDRVVSVEMFEHLNNYAALLERIAGWLTAEGRVFIHIFCHREYAYPFEDELGEENNWMARYFFSGGLMPSFDVFERLAGALVQEQSWWVNGRHYERTCNLWLENLDARRERVADICRMTYGDHEATVWVQRWRMFFMACAELFGMSGGQRWGVGHFLLRPRRIKPS